MQNYDCIIVGGGIAGLQAAIQLGRYSTHRVLVIDAGEGRSTLCRTYHNILGYPDGVSGEELRAKGRMQAERTGVEFQKGRVIEAKRKGERVQLISDNGMIFETSTVLLATGLSDRIPDIQGLNPTLGKTVYVCPDCDGYEIQDRKTVLLGSGEAGANMALVLIERTNDLLYVNHEHKQISAELHRRMKEEGIRYLEATVQEVQQSEEGYITGILTDDGQMYESERGFISFGGNRVHYELAEQLGAEIADNRHVKADPRTMIAAPNVWIAGDLGVHAEQATVAMGEGAIAAIWIHKELQRIAKESKVSQF
ncbi:NAD(P)/FAD-dependent oxidoreductase [Paenibacillus xylanexedens]|uniref:NAD(P)/FAD-dependent oxidoreductase n=1 Tax=Paenibacillus xylanexedens TaxID=528191 RepID=UPI0011A5F40F|nr:NAD(P)/FAD-dependent oxidoreductase [Paenibacillus xylanexedens]